MADLNEVRLIGRLTRDPELRSTPNGQSVCKFGLATGRKYKGQDGVLCEETNFVDVSCWGRLAETVNQYMKKGRQIYVGGRLKFESWEDKQTGQKRSKLNVVAENVQFLDGGDRHDNNERGGNDHPHTQMDTSYGPKPGAYENERFDPGEPPF